MSNNTAINLLLFCITDNDAEQIVSACRKAGRVAHIKAVQTGEMLSEALNAGRWDVLIYEAERAELDIQRCGHLLRKHQADTAVIYMGEGDPLTPPDPAVTDIISKYNIPQLASAALREQRNVILRRELLATQHALKEAEKRNNLLFTDHQDPLAYITDGMVIYANSLFCECMGHTDLDGFPIVDLISNKDQDRFKNALKKQQQAQVQQQLEISFAVGKGEIFKAFITCNSARYDDEDCIQISLQKEDNNTVTGGTDVTTQMNSKHRFQEILQDFVENERNSNSSLILISLDHFSKVRHSTSLLEVENLIASIASLVRDIMPAQHYGRVADDMIAAIAHHMPSEQVLDMGHELCKAVETEIFEIKKQSLQCTISIAVMPINHLTPPRASALMDEAFHGLEKIYADGGNHAGICQRERQRLDNKNAAISVINKALKANRLMLLFQPMINLGSAEGDHYEASLEIRNWIEGEVSAGELMRVSEREPENNKLDRWIVVEATKQLAKERETGQNLKLIINLSGNAFHDLEFCSWLSVVFKAAGLPPSSVMLQFHEESIANALKPAMNFSEQLKKLGSSISVRNFGRTQKGNKFLSHIQPTLVKPCFRIIDEPDNNQIREIVQNARAFNSQILIPNVRSAAALAMLWQFGPDFIQGSYVNDPMASMNYEFAAFS
jgi:EAL domain-containing protein (putative c-di-GMP-specific phosphodiesterase class I)/GGDEF domain-containing protein